MHSSTDFDFSMNNPPLPRMNTDNSVNSELSFNFLVYKDDNWGKGDVNDANSEVTKIVEELPKQKGKLQRQPSNKKVRSGGEKSEGVTKLSKEKQKKKKKETSNEALDNDSVDNEIAVLEQQIQEMNTRGEACEGEQPAMRKADSASKWSALKAKARFDASDLGLTSRPSEFLGSSWKNTPGFVPMVKDTRVTRSPRHRQEEAAGLSLANLVAGRDNPLRNDPVRLSAVKQAAAFMSSPSKSTGENDLEDEELEIERDQKGAAFSDSFRLEDLETDNVRHSKQNADEVFSASYGSFQPRSVQQTDENLSNSWPLACHINRDTKESFSANCESGDSSSSSRNSSSKLAMTPVTKRLTRSNSFRKIPKSGKSEFRPNDFPEAKTLNSLCLSPVKREKPKVLRRTDAFIESDLQVGASASARDKNKDENESQDDEQLRAAKSPISRSQIVLEDGITSRTYFPGSSDGEMVFVIKSPKVHDKLRVYSEGGGSSPDSTSSSPSRRSPSKRASSEKLAHIPEGLKVPEDAAMVNEEPASPGWKTASELFGESNTKAKALKKKKKPAVDKGIKHRVQPADLQKLADFLDEQAARADDKNTINTNAAHILDSEDKGGKPVWTARKLRQTNEGQRLREGGFDLAKPISAERMPVKLSD